MYVAIDVVRLNAALTNDRLASECSQHQKMHSHLILAVDNCCSGSFVGLEFHGRNEHNTLAFMTLPCFDNVPLGDQNDHHFVYIAQSIQNA